MKRMNIKTQKEIAEYILNDYEFLDDYEIIDSTRVNKSSFTAKIKDSDQKVRFVKRKFSEEYFQRFKALAKLYKNGIILADNMFLLEQCQQFYFYIIQAQIESNNPRFKTLQQHLYEQTASQAQRNNMISKVKILLDCIHQQGQFYAGLDSRNIIVDDQKHIYLSPFSLQVDLKTDCFSRAYYSPQLLVKIEEGQVEISEEIMLKWDVWSFGCIALQILLYNSPFFISTSLSRQLKLINSWSIENQEYSLEDNLKNILINSLRINPQLRNISIHKIQPPKNEPVNVNLLQKTIQKNSNNSKEADKGQLRQLNINRDKQIGDSQLIINLFTLEKVPFENQLHLTIFVNKKYHFYVDFQQDTKKYKLNRRITIRNSFKEFNKLLENPIVIQLKEENRMSRIQINLQTLVLSSEGKRLWDQPLLGTYKAQCSSHFPNAKIKVSCILKSPEIDIENVLPVVGCENRQDQKTENSLINQSKSQAHTLSQKSINIEPKIRKKTKKSQKREQFPSISEISNSISLITEQFRKKMSREIEPIQQDEIKRKIQTLLQIQQKQNR